ncbi:MAG TPA: hypothetical protein VGO57_06600 [Verrucomicrobiae bacterium]|jgi:hypothetical protein
MMTLEKLDKLLRQIIGWAYLFLGILAIVAGAYICCADGRIKVLIIFIMQIPVDIFIIWVGVRKLRDRSVQPETSLEPRR